MCDLTSDGTAAANPPAAGVDVVMARDEVDAAQEPGARHVVVGLSGTEETRPLLLILEADEGVSETGTAARLLRSGAIVDRLESGADARARVPLNTIGEGEGTAEGYEAFAMNSATVVIASLDAADVLNENDEPTRYPKMIDKRVILG